MFHEDNNIFIVTVKRNDHTQQWNETLELTVNHEKLKKNTNNNTDFW